MCSSCGAPGHASCACGVAYVPAASKALAAIAETPQLSDRSIAKRIGISKDSVRRARTGASAPVEPMARLGADGKVRQLPRRKLKRVTVESSIDPMFMKISELAAIMDTAVRAISRRLLAVSQLMHAHQLRGHSQLPRTSPASRRLA